MSMAFEYHRRFSVKRSRQEHPRVVAMVRTALASTGAALVRITVGLLSGFSRRTAGPFPKQTFFATLESPMVPQKNRTTWTLLTPRIPDAQFSLSMTSTIPVCFCERGSKGEGFG